MTDLGRYKYPKEHQGLSVVIFGAGETARIAFRGFLYDSPYHISQFVVDDKFAGTLPNDLFGYSVSTLSDFLSKPRQSTYAVFVAFSAKNLSQDRAERIEVLSAKGIELISYVSSRAFVDHDVTINRNVMVLENNTLQSEVAIGAGTLVWSGNHIGHQTVIGENNFISSHVCIGGQAKIGKQNYFGMNCTVRDTVTLSDHIVIGSNSFVNKDIFSAGVYFGTPAKILEGRDPRLSI
jgi:sugar O-acyltransferase (sialic acid O-acetyltransferase NeuD family)